MVLTVSKPALSAGGNGRVELLGELCHHAGHLNFVELVDGDECRFKTSDRHPEIGHQLGQQCAVIDTDNRLGQTDRV